MLRMHGLCGYKKHSRVFSGDIEKPPCKRLHPTHHPAPSGRIGAARSCPDSLATVMFTASSSFGEASIGIEMIVLLFY
jgi:hypothetical protein